MTATDIQLIELGATFDELAASEARTVGDEDIPETLSCAVSDTSDRVAELPAASPAAMAVKARVIEYWIANGPDRVVAVAASLVRDLRQSWAEGGLL
jgi:hypothetical protein